MTDTATHRSTRFSETAMLGTAREDGAALLQAADPAVAVAHVAAATFLAYIASRVVPGPWLVAGPVALAGIHGFLAIANSRGVRTGLIIPAALCGVMWSVLILAYFPAGKPDLQLAAGFAVGGGALALVAAFHVRLVACFAATAAPAPIFVALLLIDDATRNGALAALFALLWLALQWLAFQLSGTARARLSLLAERELLLERIEAKAHELEAAQVAEATARREAEAANASKSRFLAFSSHDLRQPLHAIGLFLEALPASGDDLRANGVVDRVRQSLDVLSKLFDALLDVSMLDTGQVDVKTEAFSAQQLLAQVKDDFASVAAACGAELRVVPTRLLLHSDPVIVRRIVQNLVSNAIRHADSGVVLIGARRCAGAACIDVIDTGPGVRPEDRLKIFQEFTKLERMARDTDDRLTMTATPPGLGLGLAIVERMATILGLEIELRSTIGHGSRFRLGRIARAEALPEHEPVVTHGEPNAMPRRRIAVFDDDADTLRATGDLLGKWGFDVDLYDAWPADLVAPPDILVCDYRLGPAATGLDVIEQTRACLGRAIPALIVTGSPAPEVFEGGRGLDAPVLSKPVRPAQLRSAVLSALAGQS